MKAYLIAAAIFALIIFLSIYNESISLCYLNDINQSSQQEESTKIEHLTHTIPPKQLGLDEKEPSIEIDNKNATKFAIATLVNKDDQQYTLLACVLGRQLLKYDPDIPRIVAYPKDKLNSKTIKTLKECGWETKPVVERVPAFTRNCKPPGWLEGQYIKFDIFKWVEYDSILYLDADTVVFKSLKSIFEYNQPNKFSIYCCDMVGSERYINLPFTKDSICNACTLLITPNIEMWNRGLEMENTIPPSTWENFRCTELGFMNMVYPLERFHQHKNICFDPWRYLNSASYSNGYDPHSDAYLFHNFRLDNFAAKMSSKTGWVGKNAYLDLFWSRIFDMIIESANFINNNIQNGIHVNIPIKPKEINLNTTANWQAIIERNRKWTDSYHIPRWLDSGILATSRFKYGCPDVCLNNIDKPIGNFLVQVDFIHILMSRLKENGVKRIHYLEIGVSAGKSFSTTLNFFDYEYESEVIAVGFDIEDINPTLKRLLHKKENNIVSVWESKTVGQGNLMSYWSPHKKYPVYYLTGSELEEASWIGLKNLGIKFNVIFFDALHQTHAVLNEQEMMVKHDLFDTSGHFLWIWDDCYPIIRPAYVQACDRAKKMGLKVSCQIIDLYGWLGKNENRHNTCIVTTLSLSEYKSSY